MSCNRVFLDGCSLGLRRFSGVSLPGVVECAGGGAVHFATKTALCVVVEHCEVLLLPHVSD